MANKALITSPDWSKRATRLAGVEPSVIARASAVRAAGVLRKPLQDAARRAGGSAALSRDVLVHEGHLNDLVMRDRGHKGDVIVGIGGESKHAEEAEELEWGGIDTAPQAWVRTTVEEHWAEVVRTWSAEMTAELDRRVVGRR